MSKKSGSPLKNPVSSLQQVAKAAVSPFTTATKAVGIKDNTMLGQAAMLGNMVTPFGANAAISQATNFKEGNQVIGEATGDAQKMRKESSAMKREGQRIETESNAADDASIALLNQQGNTLDASNSLLGNFSARTARGASELQRLLSVFEGRSNALRYIGARPGVTQTRMV